MEHDGHKIVEDKSKVVVDGAKITCSYGQIPGTKDPSFVFLRIPCSHGFLENGHLCAHEEACIPFENIPPFKSCFSPFYLSMLNYLNAWNSEDPTLKQAADAYMNGAFLLPCLLPLLNKWMNTKEKSVIENYLDLSFDFDFNPIRKKDKSI